MGSILVIALGMFHADMAIEVAIRTPRAVEFTYVWSHWIQAILWAVIFLGIGIAIGRTLRWTRPVLVGVMPAYIVVNVTQALLDIWLGQGFMFWSRGLETVAAQIASLCLAALIFVWFCTPQIEGAFTTANAKPSRLADMPLALSSWAIGCMIYCLFTLASMLMFSLRHDVAIGVSPLYLAPVLIIGLGGALTLGRKRYGLIAAALCLLLIAIRGIAAVATQTIALRQPMGRGGAPDWFLALMLPGVNAVLLLAASLFAIYAARFVHQPSASGPSVQMQNDLREPQRREESAAIREGGGEDGR